MATGDVLSIANRALLSIGARAQVSSINPSDGSPEADSISILWTPTFESLARSAQWNCLKRQAPLSLLAAAQGTPENPDGQTYPIPPTPWLYAYAYPSDCLDFRYIIPSFPANTGTSSTPPQSISNAAATMVPGGSQIPFVVQTEYTENHSPYLVILTNQDLAQGVYTVNQPNPAAWDSLFQSAMVASLAAYLVPALNLSLPLMQMSIATAEAMIKKARAMDANEGVTTMDHLPDWMRARAGAQGFGWGYGGYYGTYGGYCYGYSMNWPSAGGGGSYG